MELQDKIRLINSVDDLTKEEKALLLKSYIAISNRLMNLTGKPVKVETDEAHIKRVITCIEEITDVPYTRMSGTIRDRPITFARHLCMYALRHTTNLSLKRIGELFNRDHTSVMHAVKTIDNLSEAYDIIQNQVEGILRIFKPQLEEAV